MHFLLFSWAYFYEITNQLKEIPESISRNALNRFETQTLKLMEYFQDDIKTDDRLANTSLQLNGVDIEAA